MLLFPFWALDIAPDPVPGQGLSALLPLLVLILAVAAGYLIGRARRKK